MRRIYMEVNRYADDVGGVEDGLSVLFSPPMLNPKLMIISMQGGAGRNNRQRCWPSQMVYVKSPFGFGKRMTSDFDGAGLRKSFQDADSSDSSRLSRIPNMGQMEECQCRLAIEVKGVG